MTPAIDREALALLDEVLELDAAAREAKLRDAAHAPEAVARVRQWLAADTERDARLSPAHYVALAQADASAAVAAGARIGVWSLVRELGRGGMGSVWLAERADGDFTQRVALKLIRPDLAASDAESRFRRERRILATLKHPNIAQLLDGGVTADGRPWLAMEWVEGRTLRESIARAPLDPQRLLVLASEVAGALAHAHEAGVVHRDLKPENIMLAREGYAKVLDFGVAKLIADDAPSSATQTQPGRIIGTTPYMSPEQASGASVDFRSDQFALGALLYEAATGRAAFARDTPAETVAAVLRDTPPMGTAIAITVPPGFVRVVERCLSKDPAGRYASTHDLARDFADLAHHPQGVRAPASAPRPTRAAATAGALALLAAAVVLAWWVGRNGAVDTSAPRALRAELSIAPAERLWFHIFPMHAFALSPDGAQLVFAGQQDKQRMLYLRTLATRETVRLPGTENPTNPAFSPDGDWIVYFANGFELRKVAVRGGSSTIIAEAPNHLGGLAWSGNDKIIYSPFPGTGIWEVSASGGEPKQLTFPDLDAGEGSHVWPMPVAGTPLILYVAEIEAADTFDAGRIYAWDATSGERTLLVDGGTDPQVFEGKLYYARAGTIYSVAFDAERVALRGAPQPVYEGVAYSPAVGAAQYALAPGVSVRMLGGEGVDLIEMVIVDRAGGVEPLGLPIRYYARHQLSPDARRAVFQISGADDDLWIYDFERRQLTRLTEQYENIFPTWTPDGQYIVYSRHREPPPSVWRRRADGSGAPEQLTSPEIGSKRAQLAHDVSPDGRYVAYDQFNDIYDINIDLYDFTTKKSITWLGTPHKEHGARFSPDGRLVAYRSNISGRDEVYVQTFTGDRRWQISNDGGVDPRWRPDGRELFYQSAGTLYAVALGSGDDLAPAVPQVVVTGDYVGAYDVFPGGERFLMRKRVREPGGAGPLLIDIER
ncbi:MAG TPA: protein kinase [Candidatus Saccharimonadia bacterium]|nr:protein kinase [Candidatus Saccharimonadia bacterium]